MNIVVIDTSERSRPILRYQQATLYMQAKRPKCRFAQSFSGSPD